MVTSHLMTTAPLTERRPTLLNQIIAVEQGTKQRGQRAITDAYHAIQRAAPLSGISRTYRPIADDGEQLPGESTRVQVLVETLMDDVAAALTRMLDITLTKDATNQIATADVVVGGQILLADVPVTSLLTLEKRLTDLRTFFAALPVLDLAESWTYDEVAEAWATVPVETTRTKKLPRNHLRAPATDKHPAQVDVFNEDITVGFWLTTKYSGAIPAGKKTQLMERVQTLINAVVFARELANTIPIVEREGTTVLFDYLYA